MWGKALAVAEVVAASCLSAIPDARRREMQLPLPRPLPLPELVPLVAITANGSLGTHGALMADLLAGPGSHFPP